MSKSSVAILLHAVFAVYISTPYICALHVAKTFACFCPAKKLSQTARIHFS